MIGHEGSEEVSESAAEDGDEESVAPPDLVRENTEDEAADEEADQHEGVDHGDPDVTVAHLVQRSVKSQLEHTRLIWIGLGFLGNS